MKLLMGRLTAPSQLLRAEKLTVTGLWVFYYYFATDRDCIPVLMTHKMPTTIHAPITVKLTKAVLDVKTACKDRHQSIWGTLSP